MEENLEEEKHEDPDKKLAEDSEEEDYNDDEFD